MIKYLILILIIILIFYIINKYFIIIENYTPLINNNFKEILKNNNYTLNEKEKIISYCPSMNNCNEKSYKLSFNTTDSVRLVQNKYETNKLLRENNINNVPYSLIVNLSNVDDIINIMKQNNINYPIVLKPVNGTFGEDVYTSIMNKEQLKETVNILKNKSYDNILLEEMYYGDNYRVFVFNNNVIDIIKREKPFIIGDGVQTVEQLNNIRNNEQIKNNLFPLKELDINYLKVQKYSPSTVPSRGEKVYVSNVINLHNGAIPTKVDIKKVPLENIILFKNVTKILGLNCSGIDYLSNNIYEKYDTYDTQRLKSSKSNIVLEVNGTPDIGIHLIFDKDDEFYNNIQKQIF
jgi:cyanophycin synthetase